MKCYPSHLRTLHSTIISSTLLFGAIGVARADQNSCPISKYIFQDQDGVEAKVSAVQECFGYTNLYTGLSSKDGACYTTKEVNRIIAKMKRNDYVRTFGVRSITVLYQNRHWYFIENEIVGVPSAWNEASDAPPQMTGYKDATSDETHFIDPQDSVFDFTENASDGPDTPEHLFKGLFGKKFTYKGCQSESPVASRPDAKANTPATSQAPVEIDEGDKTRLPR